MGSVYDVVGVVYDVVGVVYGTWAWLTPHGSTWSFVIPGRVGDEAVMKSNPANLICAERWIYEVISPPLCLLPGLDDAPQDG
jgi:hypothetical protein